MQLSKSSSLWYAHIFKTAKHVHVGMYTQLQYIYMYMEINPYPGGHAVLQTQKAIGAQTWKFSFYNYLIQTYATYRGIIPSSAKTHLYTQKKEPSLESKWWHNWKWYNPNCTYPGKGMDYVHQVLEYPSHICTEHQTEQALGGYGPLKFSYTHLSWLNHTSVYTYMNTLWTVNIHVCMCALLDSLEREVRDSPTNE